MESKSDHGRTRRSIEVELERRGATLVPHGMRSLQHHLEGVRGILESWHEPEAVCLAGLMHSVYSTDALPSRLYGGDEREALRDLIGSRAERLVYLFASVVRGELLSALDAARTLPQRAAFKGRLDNTNVIVEDHELRDLIALHIANTAEQTCSPNGFPVAWLSRAARLSKLIRTKPVPVFSCGNAAVSYDSEATLLKTYAQAWKAPLAEEHQLRLRNATEQVPFVAEPFVLLALIALARGELAEGGRLAATAQSLLLEWGTAWDKRLPETSWVSIALFVVQAATAPGPEAAFLGNLVREILETAGRVPETVYVRLAALDLLATPTNDENLETALAAATETDDIFCADDANNVPERFSEFLAGLHADNPHRALAFYPGLREQAWWDPGDFPLVRALEGSAKEIAAEFAALDPRSFHAESERIQRAGSWDVFILYERGRKRTERCAAVPTTTRIIEEHSTLRTHAGLVYFSRLAPGSIVAPHQGPTNVRLRCHLGIKVPHGCSISVDNDTRTWQEGRCIVFDDSFTHAVWNSSDEERVVLIVDIWHPDLCAEEVALLYGMHQYSMGVAQSLQKYWRKNDEALVAAG